MPWDSCFFSLYITGIFFNLMIELHSKQWGMPQSAHKHNLGRLFLIKRCMCFSNNHSTTFKSFYITEQVGVFFLWSYLNGVTALINEYNSDIAYWLEMTSLCLIEQKTNSLVISVHNTICLQKYLFTNNVYTVDKLSCKCLLVDY